jgi:hypothetical protein
MKVQLLSFDGCPHWTVMDERLREALARGCADGGAAVGRRARSRSTVSARPRRNIPEGSGGRAALGKPVRREPPAPSATSLRSTRRR